MDYNLKQYFNDQYPLLFLVGAGISMDAPSGLPSAWKLIEAIVKFMTPVDIPDLILNSQIQKSLRYEYLIQIFRDYVDPSLKFLDFFEQASLPNRIHNFLADKIFQNSIVMTTNFDTLIERAMQEQNRLNYTEINQKDLKAVITKDDFLKWGDPEENLKKKLKILYKIHGSVKNYFTEESTIASVNTTLDSIGKEKEDQEEILAIPKYKQQLFKVGSKGAVLIVLGYSGGDNLDIVPELYRMKDLEKILWIDHNSSLITPESWLITSFESQNNEIDEDKINSEHQDDFLADIAYNSHIPILKIRANTKNFIEFIQYSDSLPIISKEEKFFHSKQIKSPLEWIQVHFEKPSERMKAFFAAELCMNYSEYDLALTLYQKVQKYDEEEKNLSNVANTLNRIGNLYLLTNDYENSLHYYRKAFDIDSKLQNVQGMADELGNLGLVSMYCQRNEESLNYYQQSLEINTKLGNAQNIARQMGNMASLFMSSGEFQKAYDHFVQAYEIFEQLGDFQAMGTILSNVGGLYMQTGEHEVAIDYLQKGYEIYEKISDHSSMAAQLSNIALIYNENGEYQNAIDYYCRALGIFERINHPHQQFVREKLIELEEKMKE